MSETPTTARELIKQLPISHSAQTLAVRVEAVLALHVRGKRREWTDDDGATHRGGYVCPTCDTHSPCETRRILDGLEG